MDLNFSNVVFERVAEAVKAHGVIAFDETFLFLFVSTNKKKIALM